MATFDDAIGYPRFYADGGVEITKGVFISLLGLEEFEKSILEEAIKENNK
ncbi:MAG: hypothetical protein J6X18_15400 [Bacteroidales bacterium]|nr:hypothetical protein [Bacteroidales bacterium]